VAGSPNDEEFVALARLMRAHGNRGELIAELESDDNRIFERFSEVYLWDGSLRRQRARVERSWPHKGRLVVKFEGVDSIEQAQALAGLVVQIPAALRPPAPEGRFYVTDLIGCRVLEKSSGRFLGEVQGLLETGGVPLLEVKSGEREILIPLARSICLEVNPSQRLIRVDLPEGLDEL
jgi:16S rRNA processing protein RimM